MWIVIVPWELGVLIQYPRCLVFKLFPKDGGEQDPETLQRAMAGNIMTYELNISQVIDMLECLNLPIYCHL